MSFHIHPDIAKASTLPTDFYLDSRYFEQTKEAIFARSWQFLGDTDTVAPGWAAPVTLLENYLDEPLLLTRDAENTFHCLSNVCTHRGNILLEQPRKCRELVCRYHGRRFNLKGGFVSMPEFKEVENFPSQCDNLAKLEIHTLGKWLFTALNPILPPQAFFHDMQQRIAWLPLPEFRFRPDLSKDYCVQAHWALYCENYLEGFHIPFVHQTLNAVVDYGSYTTELFPYSNLQIGLAKEGETAFNLPPDAPDYGKKVAAYYFWVFPNLMFNFYPWGLSINIVKPVGIAQTRISFLTYVWDESKLQQGAGAGLDRVEMEDEEIVQQVQKGIRSRFYKHGRYSVTREQGTHHFHRLLAQFLS
jgi:choline monooxygenase